MTKRRIIEKLRIHAPFQCHFHRVSRQCGKNPDSPAVVRAPCHTGRKMENIPAPASRIRCRRSASPPRIATAIVTASPINASHRVTHTSFARSANAAHAHAEYAGAGTVVRIIFPTWRSARSPAARLAKPSAWHRDRPRGARWRQSTCSARDLFHRPSPDRLSAPIGKLGRLLRRGRTPG